MKLLITGAFGFVGRNLSDYLAARGHYLIALDVAKQDLGAYAECLVWKDLEAIPWREVDAVVHLAGKAHDTRNVSDPQSYFEVNVGLTKKVLEAAVAGLPALAASGRPAMTFILFSSVKAVADRVEGALTEDAAPAPQTPYGRSKLEAEGAVLSAVGSRQSALRYYILRPCMIHGPGNKGNLNLLFGLVRRGLPWPLGAFENRRSFASINNVCAAVEALLSGGAEPGVYQVADDEALSTNELVALMAESLGRRAHIWRIPARLVRAVARAGDLLRLPLTSERLKKLTESYVVSNERLKRALGWQVMPVRAREGMRKTLESFGGKGSMATRRTENRR